MPILRRKLKCHYCGNQQTQRHQGPLRVWNCTSCGSDNHVDKDGQITDPPAQESIAAPRFAHPVSQNSRETHQQPDRSIFCSTCIKNQGIQNELVAQYLPPPDDPSYPQSEATIDAYRQRLEEDYPQVCIDCENRVLQRLRQAEYEAKSDNLKRMMNQSRKIRPSATYGWRHYVVWIGMVGYYCSLAAQLPWSLLALTADPDVTFTNDPKAEANLSMCLSHFQNNISRHAACASLVDSMTGIAMVTSFLTIWWNPKWRHKIEGRRGRLRGLKDLYQVQAGSQIVRFLAWVWLKDLHPSTSLPVIRVIHAFLLCVDILLAIAPWYMVKIEKLAGFSRTLGPLIPESVRARQLQERKQLVGFRAQEARSFPLSRLSDAPIANTIYEPPTPPPEDEPETDSMEWEPTQNLNIRRHQQAQATRPERSPFYGRLPPQPNNHRLNPHPQAAQISQRDSIGLPPGFFDRPNGGYISPSSSRETDPPSRRFAEPQFFGPSADSGLEGFFGRVFNLNDRPPEVTKQNGENALPVQNGNLESALATATDVPAMKKSISPASTSGPRYLHLTYMSLLGFALGFLFLSASPFVAPSFDPFRSNVAIIALAGITSLTSLLQRSINLGWQATVVFAAEFVISVIFGVLGMVEGFDFQGRYHALLCGLLAIMFWQEFFLGMGTQSYAQTRLSILENSLLENDSSFQLQTSDGMQTMASGKDAGHQDGLKQPPRSGSSSASSYQRPQQDYNQFSSREASNISSTQQQSLRTPFPNSRPAQTSLETSNTSPFIHRPPYQYISGSQGSEASRLYQRRDSFSTDTSSPDSEDSYAPTVTTTGIRTPKAQQSGNRTAYSPGTGLGGLSLDDSTGPPSARLRNRTRF